MIDYYILIYISFGLLIMLLYFKYLFKFSLQNTFQKETKILNTVNNYQIEWNVINKINNEDYELTMSNVEIYTFTKVQTSTKTKYVSNQFGILRYLNFGHVISQRQSLFQNTLRYFGLGTCSCTNTNVHLFTTSGHYTFKISNIIYIVKISKNHLLIIEKNRKAFVLIAKMAVIGSLYKYCYNQKNKVKELTYNTLNLGIWSQVAEVPDFKNIKYFDLKCGDVLLSTQKLSSKQIIEKILISIITEGIYLEPCNELLSFIKITNSKGVIIKQQQKIGLYYLNTSKNLNFSLRLKMLREILNKNGINELQYKFACHV